MKPTIAVTTSKRSGWRIFPLVALNLWLAGAKGVRWGAGRDADLDTVDGLIIGGGDDISPELYGAELKMVARLDPDRDALERRLAEDALARNIPVLGICRGAQMLNIALGGTLYQDAWSAYPNSRFVKTILPRRAVTVEADTHLARYTGRTRFNVNALHTQAVDTLGEGLRVSARDEGGMIQAVERTADPFAIGVQWHPEHLFFRPEQRAIVRALADAAAAYRRGRSQTGQDAA